jgi:probable H4MPT-linked C1 transfer pathway protein
MVMRCADVATLGWDIGGAHLKVAAVDAAGCPLAAHQLPCALWRGLDQLEGALEQALARLPAGALVARQAVTMTGELADLFADRNEGVLRILAVLRRRLGEDRLHVFAGERGFVNPSQATACANDVASANWLATAQLIASKRDEALLVDIGTTTTDLVAVRGGRVEALGHSDFERLVSGELVYTGVARTPLMAIAQAIEFEAHRVPLMAEHFATTADVYRLTAELDERCDQHVAADGGEKTAAGSARRLARMIGRDAHELPLPHWVSLAHRFRDAQLARVRHAAEQVLSRVGLGSAAPLLAAGSGAFLVAELGRQLQRPVIGFSDLFDARVEDAAMLRVCAPAVAVAILALGSGP